MNIIVNDSRIELELTKDQALESIANLSNAVRRANLTGSGYFCDGVTIEKGGESFPGRTPIRVE